MPGSNSTIELCFYHYRVKVPVKHSCQCNQLTSSPKISGLVPVVKKILIIITAEYQQTFFDPLCSRISITNITFLT